MGKIFALLFIVSTFFTAYFSSLFIQALALGAGTFELGILSFLSFAATFISFFMFLHKFFIFLRK